LRSLGSKVENARTEGRNRSRRQVHELSNRPTRSQASGPAGEDRGSRDRSRGSWPGAPPHRPQEEEDSPVIVKFTEHWSSLVRSRFRFLYSGVRVRNLDRAIRFYQQLGFRIAARGTMEHGGRWVQLKFPGSAHRLELNYYPQGSRYYVPFRPGEEFDHFGFFAPSIEDWVKIAQRAGARKKLDFVEGRSRVVYFEDPDGHWLEGFGHVARPRKRRASSSLRRRAPRPSRRT